MKRQNIALHAFALLVSLVFNYFYVSWSIFVKIFRALVTT